MISRAGTAPRRKSTSGKIRKAQLRWTFSLRKMSSFRNLVQKVGDCPRFGALLPHGPGSSWHAVRPYGLTFPR